MMIFICGFLFFYCVSCVISAEIAFESNQIFRVIPLGNSALLVKWERHLAVPSYLYVFSYQEQLNGTWGDKVQTWQIAGNEETQAKIFNLKRNTTYKIIIENEKSENLDEYFVESTTGDLFNSPPFKPDFEYSTSIVNGFTLAVTVIWLPCGKKYLCSEARAGSHFYVKYRIKSEPLSGHSIEEKEQDKITVTGFDLKPGRIYEFSVVSVDGNYQTESDVQEVFFFAATGPVQSLRATPLGGNSFFVTWKTPREMIRDIAGYNIIYTKNLMNPSSDLYFDKMKNYEPNITQLKISGLEKNTTYRIYVVPRTEFGVGIENFVDATTFGACLAPPFKPSFRYFLVKNKKFLPALKIWWLPCGQNGDCKGEKPGTSFYIRYKFKDENTYNIVSESEDDCILIHDCLPNKTYEFIVVSVYDNFQRESDPQEIVMPNLGPTEKVSEAIMGRNFTLKCELISTNPKIHWFRNDREIFRNGRKYERLENGDLLIKNSGLKDSGLFKCCDKTSLRSFSPITTIFFSVKEATRITNMKQFSMHEIDSGENLSLSCIVEKDRTLSVLTNWLKNDKRIEDSVEQKLILYSNNSLNILNATIDDSANYTCAAITRLDTVTATIFVKVRES